MNLILSLLTAGCFILLSSTSLKKHPAVYYAAFSFLSVFIAVIQWTGTGTSFPGWLRYYVWPLLSQAGFSTALFIYIMYAGAAGHRGRLQKTVLINRGNLSIIASILTLGHNAAYGKNYFFTLLAKPASLPLNVLYAAVCSLVMIVIMLLMLPSAWGGSSKYLVNIILYSIIFLGYFVLRSLKALKKTNSVACPQLFAAVPAILIFFFLIMPVFSSARHTGKDQNEIIESEQTGSAAEKGDEDMSAQTEYQDGFLQGLPADTAGRSQWKLTYQEDGSLISESLLPVTTKSMWTAPNPSLTG